MVTEASPEKPYTFAQPQLQSAGAASPISPLLREFGEGLAGLGQQASDNFSSAE